MCEFCDKLKCECKPGIDLDKVGPMVDQQYHLDKFHSSFRALFQNMYEAMLKWGCEAWQDEVHAHPDAALIQMKTINAVHQAMRGLITPAHYQMLVQCAGG